MIDLWSKNLLAQLQDLNSNLPKAIAIFYDEEYFSKNNGTTAYVDVSYDLKTWKSTNLGKPWTFNFLAFASNKLYLYGYDMIANGAAVESSTGYLYSSENGTNWQSKIYDLKADGTFYKVNDKIYAIPSSIYGTNPIINILEDKSQFENNNAWKSYTSSGLPLGSANNPNTLNINPYVEYGSRFVRTYNDKGKGVTYSDDGINYKTTSSIPTVSSAGYTGLFITRYAIYAKNLFVVSGYHTRSDGVVAKGMGQKIYTSSNGSSWQHRITILPDDTSDSDIIYYINNTFYYLFIESVSSGQTAKKFIYKSSDGYSWTKIADNFPDGANFGLYLDKDTIYYYGSNGLTITKDFVTFTSVIKPLDHGSIVCAYTCLL